MTQAWPAELLPFVEIIDQGISAIAASHDAALVPSIMRAVGTHLDAAAGEITLYLPLGASRQLLQDIAATGRLAVVFSQPTTHRAVQIKTTRMRTRALEPTDLPRLARYLAALTRELGRIGHPPEFTRAMLAHRPEETVALVLVPEQAFDQTPGAARRSAA